MLAGPVVEDRGESVALRLTKSCQVRAFGQILPQHAIGVLVAPALPCVVRCREVEVDLQGVDISNVTVPTIGGLEFEIFIWRVRLSMYQFVRVHYGFTEQCVQDPRPQTPLGHPFQRKFLAAEGFMKGTC